MYDDEIDIDDAEEVRSDSGRSPDPPPPPPSASSIAVPAAMEVTAEMRPKVERPQSANVASRAMRQTPMGKSFIPDDDPTLDQSDSTDNTDSDEDELQAAALEGAYDPKDYEHLNVTPDVREIFQYITFYTPQVIELEYKLQPFVPDFIPAVGDVDGFIKIARPDGVDDKLGMIVLDEPCISQSEPAVMHLRLRAATKQSSAKTVVVKKLQNAEKNPKAIEKWIKDIGELHKTKPAPTIQYSRPMPDIDSLMQEWPPEFEEKLNEVGLPLEDLEVDLLTYVDVICALFDIPRYESRIESLHVLFSLFSAVKNYKDDNRNETPDQDEP
ncbi:intraflagellar transport 46 homolog (Chlamydomonas) [Nesidiocoris tenuis]|uniref:Intraflagellar transport protein 46 homolog n=2 Tax=Nesidiocoris tenuis TaxID=355587 RepID=A0ABN7B6I9_9HEMI|nr:intraflagellar transport 46 homolog (Chlamydomonas) [Nesidiocoris tenuis]